LPNHFAFQFEYKEEFRKLLQLINLRSYDGLTMRFQLLREVYGNRRMMVRVSALLIFFFAIALFFLSHMRNRMSRNQNLFFPKTLEEEGL